MVINCADLLCVVKIDTHKDEFTDLFQKGSFSGKDSVFIFSFFVMAFLSFVVIFLGFSLFDWDGSVDNAALPAMLAVECFFLAHAESSITFAVR